MAWLFIAVLLCVRDRSLSARFAVFSNGVASASTLLFLVTGLELDRSLKVDSEASVSEPEDLSVFVDILFYLISGCLFNEEEEEEEVRFLLLLTLFAPIDVFSFATEDK